MNDQLFILNRYFVYPVLLMIEREHRLYSAIAERCLIRTTNVQTVYKSNKVPENFSFDNFASKWNAASTCLQPGILKKEMPLLVYIRFQSKRYNKIKAVIICFARKQEPAFSESNAQVREIHLTQAAGVNLSNDNIIDAGFGYNKIEGPTVLGFVMQLGKDIICQILAHICIGYGFYRSEIGWSCEKSNEPRYEQQGYYNKGEKGGGPYFGVFEALFYLFIIEIIFHYFLAKVAFVLILFYSV